MIRNDDLVRTEGQELFTQFVFWSVTDKNRANLPACWMSQFKGLS
jgi:hypothetical protein